MDAVSAALDLQQLLVAHNNSNRQISALDEFIRSTSQRQLLYTINGSPIQTLHLTLRLSVCKGIHSMYTQYQQRKWTQVQRKASSIISTIQENGEQADDLLSWQPESNTRVDKSVGQWSLNYCEFHRNI